MNEISQASFDAAAVISRIADKGAVAHVCRTAAELQAAAAGPAGHIARNGGVRQIQRASADADAGATDPRIAAIHKVAVGNGELIQGDRPTGKMENAGDVVAADGDVVPRAVDGHVLVNRQLAGQQNGIVAVEGDRPA